MLFAACHGQEQQQTVFTKYLYAASPEQRLPLWVTRVAPKEKETYVNHGNDCSRLVVVKTTRRD